MTSRMFNNGYGGKTSGLYNMIFLSLVAHFVVIAIVLVSFPTSLRHLTFGPVYSVQLVSSEALIPQSRESSLMKEIVKSSEVANSVIFKKEISSYAATPVKKEETNRVNIEKAISAIKQKEPALPEKTAGTKPAAKAAAVNGARMTTSEVNAQRQEYIGVVWSRIQSNWALPPTLMPKENIEAIIAVRIVKSGGVEQVNIEKRSGNNYFDEAALKTVRKSSPFPPFPSRMAEESIEIGIRFHSAQFR